MNSLRIAVVGGSLGGLFAAALLRRDGHEVTVFERSVHGLAGRGAGLVGQADLARLLAALDDDGASVVGVTARERIVFNRDGEVVERLKTPQTQISWDVLYDAVRKRVPASAYRLGRAVSRVNSYSDKAFVHLADGEVFEADLVIGADGLGSCARNFVTQEVANRYAGYVAWRGLIPEGDLPSSSAKQLSDRFAFFNPRGGHMLGYTVPGANGETGIGTRRYNWVWYRVAELETELVDRQGTRHPFSMPPGAASDEAVEHLRMDARMLLPWVFAEAVEAEPMPFVQGIFDYVAPTMSKGRVALVGDAAVVVRPHTAMGVSKAAGDVLALRSHIANGDLNGGLAAFSEERVAAGRAISAYGQRLGNSLGFPR